MVKNDVEVAVHPLVLHGMMRVLVAMSQVGGPHFAVGCGGHGCPGGGGGDGGSGGDGGQLTAVYTGPGGGICAHHRTRGGILVRTTTDGDRDNQTSCTSTQQLLVLCPGGSRGDIPSTMAWIALNVYVHASGLLHVKV